MDILLQPWPWYVSGPLISVILFLFFYYGKHFGVSSNLETLCTIAGADKFSDYFKKSWRKRDWALFFLAGLIIGGFISNTFLTPYGIDTINPKTIEDLQALGFEYQKNTYVPEELFSLDAILSIKGFLLLIVAGILIGFGTRYADGCTSGHAITGLSNLQLPSLVAVIGFFIGGLIMIWLIFPLLFS